LVFNIHLVQESGFRIIPRCKGRVFPMLYFPEIISRLLQRGLWECCSYQVVARLPEGVAGLSGGLLLAHASLSNQAAGAPKAGRWLMRINVRLRRH